MKSAVVIAIAIVAWAAVFTIDASFQSLSGYHVAASVVLTLAVAMQRINGIQKWLAGSKPQRKIAVERLAQSALMELCQNRTVSDDLLSLRIHVWEVPVWYRKLFHYRLRSGLKRIAQRKGFRWCATWGYSPLLNRVATVGLVKVAPSGVRFRKGIGIVGVCIANNDRAEILKIDIRDSRYRKALRLTDELAWSALPADVTRGLSLSDANRLAHSYGEVIAAVVQHVDTGEAVGCVTISVRPNTGVELQVTKQDSFKQRLGLLAGTIAPLLSH